MSMIRLMVLFVAAWLPPAAGAIPPELKGFDDAEIMRIELPDWFLDTSLSPDMQEYLAAVRKAGKKGLIINYETDGCSYCKLFLDTTLKQDDIVARIRRHFDMLGLDMFDDSEMTDFDGRPTTIKAFVKAQGVQFTPTVIFYDPLGRPVFRAHGYYDPERFRLALDYVLSNQYDRMSFRDWSASRMQQASGSAALVSDPLFAKPPHRLARNRRPARQPLMVLFERRGCETCEEWHRDVLSDERIRAILKQFDIVQLDMQDRRSRVIRPDGQPTSPAAWADELDLSYAPSIVLFDELGRQRLLIDFPVLHQRLERSLLYMTEKAYDRGITYQRFTREKTAQRLQREAGRQGGSD